MNELNQNIVSIKHEISNILNDYNNLKNKSLSSELLYSDVNSIKNQLNLLRNQLGKNEALYDELNFLKNKLSKVELLSEDFNSLKNEFGFFYIYEHFILPHFIFFFMFCFLGKEKEMMNF
jgi:DNA repair ATPase RecN